MMSDFIKFIHTPGKSRLLLLIALAPFMHTHSVTYKHAQACLQSLIQPFTQAYIRFIIFYLIYHTSKNTNKNQIASLIIIGT